MMPLDLSGIPHEWAKGTVVILAYPEAGDLLCFTLPPEEADDAERAFGEVCRKVAPEVIVMFEADGMPDRGHAPLAVFPQPLWS